MKPCFIWMFSAKASHHKEKQCVQSAHHPYGTAASSFSRFFRSAATPTNAEEKCTRNFSHSLLFRNLGLLHAKRSELLIVCCWLKSKDLSGCQPSGWCVDCESSVSDHVCGICRTQDVVHPPAEAPRVSSSNLTHDRSQACKRSTKPGPNVCAFTLKYIHYLLYVSFIHIEFDTSFSSICRSCSSFSSTQTKADWIEVKMTVGRLQPILNSSSAESSQSEELTLTRSSASLVRNPDGSFDTTVQQNSHVLFSKSEYLRFSARFPLPASPSHPAARKKRLN